MADQIATSEGRLSERELRQIILSHIETAEGGEGSNLSNERKRNLDYYSGERYGDEREGHSQIITREVMDVVEWIVPMVMRIFHGTDQVGRFEPVGQEDQKVADRRTDYVNHVYLKDNPGYEVSTDVLKSGLVEKNGYWQISWDEQKVSRRTEYTGLTEDAIDVLMDDEEASEVFEVSREPTEPDAPAPPQPTPDGAAALGEPGLAGPVAPGEPDIADSDPGSEPRFDVTIRRIFLKRRVKVESVPPEEMIITARAKSLDHAIESGGLVGRRYTLTRGQLVAMGYDEEEIRNIASVSARDNRGEKQNRYQDQRNTEAHRIHWSQEEIAVVDAWLKLDFDGDGYAEMRMCRLAGESASSVFLENEETDDHPFVDWTPIRKHFSQEGIAVADVICELQLLKSTLWRQLLDSLYSSVNPEYEVVKDQVADWDSVLIDEPGNMKFVEAQGTITPLAKPFVGAQAIPVLDKVDQVIEGRSGVSTVSAGLNPDLLQPHAEGTVERIMSAAQERVGLIARNFAEFGFKNVMLKIAKVISANQDQPRELRLRNQLVQVDPRKWAAEFDVDIDVGLGTGNESLKIAQLNFIAAKQELILQQLGPINPLVSLKQYYNTLALLTVKADLPSADPFFMDPTSPKGKENAAFLAQQQQSQAQTRQQQAAQILALEAQKTAQKADEAQTKALLEFQKFVFEQDFQRDKLAAELGLKAQELEAKFGVEFDRLMLDQFNQIITAQAQPINGAAPAAQIPGGFDAANAQTTPQVFRQ